MVMTILVSTSSLVFGLVIGTIFASFKLSNSYVLKTIAEFYTTVIRGVPELLVIYLLFFGGSSAVMYVAKIFGHMGYIELSPFTIGTIAVGAISGAYSTEVIRGAILAVPKVQFEAARTLGMKKYALSIITAGAFGNIIDRAIDNKVTDFLHLEMFNFSFFIFNFADAFITTGAILIIYFEIVHKPNNE